MANKEVRQDVKKRVSTFYLVLTATFVALAFAATMVLQVPVGIGYVNFGDAVVMTSSVVLGPYGAAIVGLLGPALADIATGYAIYAPFTAVIKGLEGLVCGLIFKHVLKSRNVYLRALIAFAVGAVIVVVGYFFADFLLVLFGAIESEGGLFTAALLAGVATLLGSLLQVLVSVAIAMIVAPKLPNIDFFSAGKNR